MDRKKEEEKMYSEKEDGNLGKLTKFDNMDEAKP